MSRDFNGASRGTQDTAPNLARDFRCLPKLAKVACFTSFTFSYLGKARLLASTLKRHHPDWHLVAVIADRPPPGCLVDGPGELFDEVVWADSLPIENVASWIFKHTVVETCTAVKGPVLQRLAEAGYGKIIYLDPDIAVVNSLQPVVDLLDTHSLVLTPHQLTPETSSVAVRDNEIGSLKHGIFNLGFIAVRADTEGLRFARWWSERLLEHCYDDISNGLFTDQRWCDHVPVFFGGVHILKDPGYNVASWNLSGRKLHFERDGRLLVNGVLLRFYHVTKFGPIGQAMTLRYAGANTAVHEVWCWYRNTLKTFEEPSIPKSWWAYGQYSSGTPVTTDERRLYRDRIDLQRAFPDPFDSEAGGYEAWFRANCLGGAAASASPLVAANEAHDESSSERPADCDPAQLLQPAAAPAPEGAELTRYGAVSCFPGEDLISRFLRHYGEWGFLESLFLLALSPARIFDIGAYVGTFSLAMRAAAPKFILAVEPNPEAHDKLSSNLARNLQTPFCTVNAAVTRATGEVTGGLSQADNHGSFSIAVRGPEDLPRVTVPVRTLKSLREEFGAYDLLKLDVEGAEADAILSDHEWIAEHKPAIWAECNESPASLALLTLLLATGYEVHFYRYPVFNPANFNKRPDRLFPAAFEAGLLAVCPGGEVHCPVQAMEAGAGVVRVRTIEELRRALWLTPRWGESGWEQLSATELAALLARTSRSEGFEQFLAAEAPPLARVVDRHEPPMQQAVDARPLGAHAGLAVSDDEETEDDGDEGAPMRALARRFGGILGCACSDSRYMTNGPQALRCAGCGRQLRLSGPILVDSQRTEIHNSLEDLDYDALHGASLAGSRHLGNRWLEHIRQKIPLPEPLRILEIGAGTGQLSLGLVLNGGFESLIVSDLSEKFLLANLAFIQAGLETLVPAERHALLARLCFLSCAVEDLPVRPESVNVVVASSVLHHMDDYESALRKLHRVLVPGGIAFFSEPVIEGKAFVGFMASLVKKLDERAPQPVFTSDEHKLLGDLAILCTRGYWESVAPQLKGTADDKHMFSMAQLRQCALAQGWSEVDAFAYDPIQDGLLGIMESSLQMMQVRPEPLRTYRHLFEAFQRQVIDEVPEQVCTPHAFVILRK